MANEQPKANEEPKAKKPWYIRLWETGPDGKIPWPKLLWLALLAGVISFLVLYYGGVALESAFEIWGDAPKLEWAPLGRFSLGAAVMIGALTLCWRLINRTEGQARLGTALFLIGIVLFGVFVWPTPWTYRRFGCEVFQSNRFSGDLKPVTTLPACEPAAALGTATAIDP